MNHIISWEENGENLSRKWVSQSHLSPPKKILTADDSLKADVFYQSASQGSAFIWRGDFQNAKQLLQAVERRISSQAGRKKNKDIKSAKELFHQHRQAQAHRAQLLSRLLVEVEADFSVNLRRAPDAKAAIAEALAVTTQEPHQQNTSFVISLRELLGFIGAHEWRKKGVFIAELDNVIHPYYSVFSTSRGEYLSLIAEAPLPATCMTAIDVGTGTGVIAAILAKRGVQKITATDLNPSALECAQENINRLGFASQVEVKKCDMFPLESDGSAAKADLVVCNPPWVPARATSAVETAVYDEDSAMLRSFLSRVTGHLNTEGEAWLIMSDLAEHLGLREPGEIERLITDGGLKLIARHDTKPRHKKTQDQDDLLHQARAKEITSLWQLRKITRSFR